MPVLFFSFYVWTSSTYIFEYVFYNATDFLHFASLMLKLKNDAFLGTRTYSREAIRVRCLGLYPDVTWVKNGWLPRFGR